MRKTVIKRIAAVLTALVLIICSLPAGESRAAASDDTSEIVIDSVEDMLDFAEKCRLDTWSVGKTIKLACDIDLTGSGFEPIPSFSGDFEGQGHTISGLDITSPYSPAGLFMVVRESALIANLNVSGSIDSAESCDMVGGIAGCNYGRITYCTFTGTIDGDGEVGAIVGSNELTGSVERCSSNACVTGKSMTGGIAGSNYGAIFKCSSSSKVNTSSQDASIDIDSLDFDLSSTISAITSLDTYNISTDSGGIAGYSSGYILSCSNSGTIGYPHIGYNLGGIAGRSSGFISNCSNSGTVYGRKNLGGIVGIAEPYTVLNTSADKMAQLSEEIELLNDMINGMVDDAEGSSSAVSSRLDKISAAADDASSRAEGLTDDLTDYWNDTVSEVNRASLILDDAIERLNNVTDILPDISDNLTKGIDDLEKTVEHTGYALEIGEDALNTLSQACDSISSSITQIDAGLDMVSEGLDIMDQGFEVRDTEQVDAAVEEILGGISDMIDAMSDISTSMQDLSSVLVDSAGWRNDFVTELNAFADQMEKMSVQLQKLSDAIAVIDANVVIHSDKLETGIDELQQAIEYFSTAAGQMQTGMSAAEAGMNEISEGFDDLSQGFTDNSDLEKAAAITKIADGFDDLAASMDDLADAADNMSDGFSHLSTALTNLDEAVEIKDQDAIDGAFEDIEEALSSIATILSDMSDILVRMARTMSEMNTWIDRLNDVLVRVTDAFANLTDAMQVVDDGVQTIDDNVDIDSGKLIDGAHEIKDGLDEADKGLDDLEDAMDLLSDGLEQLGLAADELKTAMDWLNSSLEYFETASGLMTDALNEADNLVDYLNTVDPIQLAPISKEIDEEADDLFDSVNEILNQAELLNKDVKGESDKLLEDVRAINDQANVVAQLMIDIVEDLTGTEVTDYFTDTSTEDYEETSYGRVLACVNNGTAYGDLAVGGVVGSMMLYDAADPENDASVSLSSLYHKKYERKCVIDKCINYGKVTAKRSDVGGICGEMDLGLITDCEFYGTASSESGDYVGGIVGTGTSTIRNCFAKGWIGGGKYIGGIVGCASEDTLGNTDLTVSGCYAMVELLEGSRFLGSIAGYDNGEFTDNYYVSDDLAGINRTSFTGKAEPMTYAELLEVDDLPEGFKSFSIIFKVDDEVMDTVTFMYGDSFGAEILPDIPEVEGCYSNWDATVFENMHFDKVVNAVYTPFTTALAGNLKRSNGLNAVYVEGLFDDLASLRVSTSPYSGNAPEQADECLHLEFDPDGYSEHIVRLLPTDSILSKLLVYVYNGSEWEKVDYEEIGSYVAFTVQGTSCDIATVHTTSIPVIYIAAGAGALCLLILILVIVLSAKKKKKRREKYNVQ